MSPPGTGETPAVPRLLRPPAVVGGLLAAAVLLAAPARATPAALDVDALAARLAEDPVLVVDGSAVTPDEDAVSEAVRGLPVPTYVVVLPQEQVDAGDSGIDGVLLRVVEALQDPRAVAVVVTDQGELQAGEGGTSGVDASRTLDAIVQARAQGTAFDGAALTGALLEFAEEVEQQASGPAPATADQPPTRQAVGVAGLVGVVVLAGALSWSRAQRKVRQAAPLSDATPNEGGW